VLIREPRPTSLSDRVRARLGDPDHPTHALTDFLSETGRHAAAAAAGLRDYGVGAQILLDLGVRDMVLLSDRPRNIVGIEGYGLRVHEWRTIPPLIGDD
jgi:3,4-dihydroxy 2-butanone 4-phosphate synthase / GTP cyclohydrolase II